MTETGMVAVLVTVSRTAALGLGVLGTRQQRARSPLTETPADRVAHDREPSSKTASTCNSLTMSARADPSHCAPL
ncbi:hypothetical protein GCM10018780_12810 [Streptomyces lanatus]|nr:hypothetical protein GCM10018780_12810 [Streptomyces lanatus]